MSDEDLGKHLREIVGKPFEDAFAKHFGGEPIRNALSNQWRMLKEMLQDESERWLEAAIDAPREALVRLAFSLALRGEYEKAGRAYRAFFEVIYPTLLATERVAAQDQGRQRREAKARANKETNWAVWRSIGTELRMAESVPSPNTTLAAKIRKRIGFGSEDTIRQALPHLGLDAKTWRERRKSEKPVKPKSRSAQRKNHRWRRDLARRK